MRALITTILIFSSLAAMGQQKISENEYHTRQGLIIKTGDTLVLGAGSLPNGNFNYVSEVTLWNGTQYLTKNMTSTRLLVVAVRGTDKIIIECRYLGKQKPRIAVEPDAAFIKEEVFTLTR